MVVPISRTAKKNHFTICLNENTLTLMQQAFDILGLVK
jgi:hypothetical protein